MRRAVLILVSALTLGITTTAADRISDDRQPAYEYTVEEVNAAAEADLDSALATFRLAGKLNRNTPEFARVRLLFAHMINAAMFRGRAIDCAPEPTPAR